MYYRLYDPTCDRYMATGYNAASEQELHYDLCSWMEADVCDDESEVDYHYICGLSSEAICEIKQLIIETSEIPFKKYL